MIKIEISQNHTQFFAQLNSLYSSKMSSRITLLYDIWVEREGGRERDSSPRRLFIRT